jgi:hypothetical protein
LNCHLSTLVMEANVSQQMERSNLVIELEVKVGMCMCKFVMLSDNMEGFRADFLGRNHFTILCKSCLYWNNFNGVIQMMQSQFHLDVFSCQQTLRSLFFRFGVIVDKHEISFIGTHFLKSLQVLLLVCCIVEIQFCHVSVDQCWILHVHVKVDVDKVVVQFILY